MEQFDITYFHGPFSSYMDKAEVIEDIAKSGITLVPLNSSTEVNKTALPLLHRYGLRAIVQDTRVSKVYAEDDLTSADAVVKDVVEDYREYDNVIGWDIVDEPDAAKFPVLAAIVNAFRRYSPDKETVINLFPNYASPAQLGTKDYLSYLESFVNIVRPHFISYDHYHFLGRENRKKSDAQASDERERLIRAAAEKTVDRGGFFENIEDVRRIGLKYDIDAMLIILLTEHGIYRNLTRSELFWEANMCLAYGMRRISYFTYWEPAHDDFWQWTNAMCDTEGNKMQHYFDVQAINAHIADAGRWLFDKRSTAVFHIGKPEAGASAFAGYRTLTQIDGEDGVIGFFDDGSAYLVNRDYLHERKYVLHTSKPVSVRKNGVFEDAGTSPSFTLGAGEAVLLKIAD